MDRGMKRRGPSQALPCPGRSTKRRVFHKYSSRPPLGVFFPLSFPVPVLPKDKN